MKQEWLPQRDQTALLVGNYVHSYFESDLAHAEFVESNKEAMLSTRGATKGKLKKEYQVADKMIETLEADEFFENVYQGKKEVIVKGNIFGQRWKGKIDCLNLDQGYFVDLKTTQDIHKRFWNSERRQWVPFVTQYNYFMQMAVYRELIKQTFKVDCIPLMMAVSKDNVPDKAAISFTDADCIDEMQAQLNTIESMQGHIVHVLAGEDKPTLCGHCDYCRSLNVLSDFVSPFSLLDE